MIRYKVEKNSDLNSNISISHPHSKTYSDVLTN